MDLRRGHNPGLLDRETELFYYEYMWENTGERETSVSFCTKGNIWAGTLR